MRDVAQDPRKGDRIMIYGQIMIRAGARLLVSLPIEHRRTSRGSLIVEHTVRSLTLEQWAALCAVAREKLPPEAWPTGPRLLHPRPYPRRRRRRRAKRARAPVALLTDQQREET